MSKKVYCKYCGRELENGKCFCDEFIAEFAVRQSKNKNLPMRKIICDTCGSKVDADALYCPYCGLPTNVDGKITNLQKELRGENALDVIDVYKEDFKKAKTKNGGVSLSFLLMLSITMFIIGTVFGYTVLPSVRKFIGDVKIMLTLSKDNANENTESSTDLENNSSENTIEPTSIVNEEKATEDYNNSTPDKDSVDVNDNNAEDNEIDNSAHNDNKNNAAKPSTQSNASQKKSTESNTEKRVYRDEWVTINGDTYAYDSNGNMIRATWVNETDANGKPNSYYFKGDGKLATDTWIDDTYYVGSDGAMYKSCQTPDGDYVDSNGQIIEETEDETNLIEVDTSSPIQYAEPNSNAETISNTQTSAVAGKITGVEATKKYPLYVDKITRVTEQVSSGSKKCNLIYYVPVFKGSNEEEVAKVNESFNHAFKVTFDDLIKKQILSQSTLPKSVVFDEVRQQKISQTQIQINISGRMTQDSSALNQKLKYRFIYDRKSETMTKVEIIPNS